MTQFSLLLEKDLPHHDKPTHEIVLLAMHDNFPSILSATQIKRAVKSGSLEHRKYRYTPRRDNIDTSYAILLIVRRLIYYSQQVIFLFFLLVLCCFQLLDTAKSASLAKPTSFQDLKMLLVRRGNFLLLHLPLLAIAWQAYNLHNRRLEYLATLLLLLTKKQG